MLNGHQCRLIQVELILTLTKHRIPAYQLYEIQLNLLGLAATSVVSPAREPVFWGTTLFLVMRELVSVGIIYIPIRTPDSQLVVSQWGLMSGVKCSLCLVLFSYWLSWLQATRCSLMWSHCLRYSFPCAIESQVLLLWLNTENFNRNTLSWVL